jgi:hypothetical protein
MISLKVFLSTAAALALVLPIAMPTASFADPQDQHRAGPRAAGGNFHPGGNMHTGGNFNSGGNFHPGGNPQFSGGNHYRRGGNFGAGVAAGVAGAAIGGALASQAYYGGQGYYYGAGPGYYDDQSYVDGGVVAEVPAAGGGDVAYCMQTYRSYDPRSGTYLGNDGYRHPCP